jgi:hypothetical protein
MWHPRWNGSKWQAQIGRELVGIHHASIVQSMILWLYFFGEISTAMTHSEGHLNKYISSGGQPNADLKPLLNILYSSDQQTNGLKDEPYLGLSTGLIMAPFQLTTWISCK